ncbi:hypothetical protein TB2_007478 [Malus domestica]
MSARNLPRLTAMVSPLGLVLHTSFKAATTEHRSGGKTYWVRFQLSVLPEGRVLDLGSSPTSRSGLYTREGLTRAVFGNTIT